VCAVALVGCHKEPVNVSLMNSTNVWITNTYPSDVYVTNVFSTNSLMFSNIDFIEPLEYKVALVEYVYNDHKFWLTIHANTNHQMFYPALTTLETTHKPILSHSNNVWIIRFEP
jgi:hypothetical protein